MGQGCGNNQEGSGLKQRVLLTVGRWLQDAKKDALAFHDQLAAIRASEMEVSARLGTELR